MALGDVANPRIWQGADIHVAPVGTTAPTDLVTALSVTWKPLGLLGEDGLTESRASDSNDFFAWGGILVRTTRSKFKRSFKVVALEDNLVVWGIVNPGSSAVTTTGVTTRTVKTPISDPRAFVLTTTDGTITQRRVVPKGQVSIDADVKWSDSDLTVYELTIDVYPSAAGVLYLDITNDPQAVTP